MYNVTGKFSFPVFPTFSCSTKEYKSYSHHRKYSPKKGDSYTQFRKTLCWVTENHKYISFYFRNKNEKASLNEELKSKILTSLN